MAGCRQDDDRGGRQAGDGAASTVTWCGRRWRPWCQALMEGEVSGLIGAELGERRPEDRLTHRNGYRSREWQTRAGTVELQIPKIRR